MTINNKKTYKNRYLSIIDSFKIDYINITDKVSIKNKFESNEKNNIIKKFFKEKSKEKINFVYNDKNYTDKKSTNEIRLNLDVFANKSVEMPIFLILFIANLILKKYNYNPVFKINSIGSSKKTEKYISYLKKIYNENKKELSEEEKKLIKENILNIFKIPSLEKKIDPSRDNLVDQEYEIFKNLIDNLENLKINYEFDNSLIDLKKNFTRNIIKIEDKKTSEIIGYGAEYTNMIKDITKKTNYKGFGLTLTIKKDNIKYNFVNKNKIFTINFTKDPDYQFVNFISFLNDKNILSDFSIFKSTYSDQLEDAELIDPKYVLILTKLDLLENNIILKNLEENSVNCVSISDLPKKLLS